MNVLLMASLFSTICQPASRRGFNCAARSASLSLTAAIFLLAENHCTRDTDTEGGLGTEAGHVYTALGTGKVEILVLRSTQKETVRGNNSSRRYKAAIPSGRSLLRERSRKHLARALAAHTAETEKINFLVGTQSLRRTNQVQLIEFDDDTSLVTKQTFEHPAGEVWRICAAPQSVNLIATVYNNTQDYCGEFGAAIWRLPLEGSTSGVLDDTRGSGEQVEKVCSLDGASASDPQAPGSPVPGLGSQMWSVVWAPEDDARLVTLVDNHLYYWDVQAAGKSAKVVGEVTVEGRGSVSLGSGRWYPHQQGSQVAATHGSSVRAWDLRSMKSSWCVEGAHMQLVRDLDFNPNMQYYLATCGDDCKTKFWDIRNTEQPLKELSDHSHWVWSVRYNASYDQLVLTCSSDQRVILSNLPSIASQPFGTMVDQEESKEEKEKAEGAEEGVIQTYDDHEDSVYAVEWSAADFWTFASLSYDGRLVINKVPRSVKYKQFM